MLVTYSITVCFFTASLMYTMLKIFLTRIKPLAAAINFKVTYAVLKKSENKMLEFPRSQTGPG